MSIEAPKSLIYILLINSQFFGMLLLAFLKRVKYCTRSDMTGGALELDISFSSK